MNSRVRPRDRRFAVLHHAQPVLGKTQMIGGVVLWPCRSRHPRLGVLGEDARDAAEWSCSVWVRDDVIGIFSTPAFRRRGKQGVEHGVRPLVERAVFSAPRTRYAL